MDGRPRPAGDRIVRFDRYLLNIPRRRLTRNGSPIALPARAFDLLVLLVAADGAALSRAALYEALWPDGYVEDGNLTQHVYVLRRALDPSGDGRRFIATLPRHGYRFALPVLSAERPAARALDLRGFGRIALAAALALTFVLTGSSVHSRVAPLGPDAAAAYALGVYHWNMRTPSELALSMQYFHKTVASAPQSPFGYAGLAEAYAILADGAKDRSKQQDRYVREAAAQARAALERDRHNVEAHTVVAFIAERFHDDSATADREYRIALDLDPNYATAHHWFAISQFSRGRLSLALREWQTAHQLAPTSEVISRWLGIGYFYTRRPNEALAMFNETIKLQPNDDDAWAQRATVEEQLGRFDQALASLKHLKRSPSKSADFTAFAEARVRASQRGGRVSPATLEMLRRLARGTEIETADVAYFFLVAGKKDEALQVLVRNAGSAHYKMAAFVKYDPRLDALRGDPRFKRLYG